ncbi:hypothetical protein P9X10_02320 [Bacillus cereus]|nr:hypothetical protein [Bacillus cereus]
MSKESKQKILDVYKEIWNSNPPSVVLGLTSKRQCVGIAQNPKEMVSVLNNKTVSIIVIVTSDVDYQYYDKKTGEKIGENGSIGQKSSLYDNYPDSILEHDLEVNIQGNTPYRYRIGQNHLFVESLLQFGVSKNLDCWSEDIRKYPVDMHVHPIRFLNYKQGYIRFVITSEQVGIQLYREILPIHDADVDIDFNELIVMIAKVIDVQTEEFKVAFTEAMKKAKLI